VDLDDVCTVIRDRLDTIDGLRAYDFHPGTIHPPAAWPLYPTGINFDATYRGAAVRGMDRITVPVVVMVGAADDRRARSAMAPYVAGSGTKSVKRALETAAPGEVAAFDDLYAGNAEFDFYTVGDVDYLIALFTCTIVGSA